MTAQPSALGAELAEHSRLLFSIAYRMTGSAADAEELAQEACVRYLRAGDDDIREPRAFLVTTVTRLSIDRLRLARTQRETYWGTWLPEPVGTEAVEGPEPAVERRETLTFGFLTLLERLTPPERAVFVLREAFGYPYADIAAAVDLDEAHCRQLHRRALTRVRAGRQRFRADKDKAQALLQRFMAASVGLGVEPLEELLADDVTLWADGGGRATANLHPLAGRDRVATLLRGIIRLAAPGTTSVVADVNGLPSMAVVEPRGLVGVYQLIPSDDGRVAAISAIRNPEKLGRVAASLGVPVGPGMPRRERSNPAGAAEAVTNRGG